MHLIIKFFDYEIIVINISYILVNIYYKYFIDIHVDSFISFSFSENVGIVLLYIYFIVFGSNGYSLVYKYIYILKYCMSLYIKDYLYLFKNIYYILYIVFAYCIDLIGFKYRLNNDYVFAAFSILGGFDLNI